MSTNIKKAREAAGMSQKQVALELHVSAPTVSDWENGNMSPSAANLKALASLLGTTTDYLLGIETKKAPAENGGGEDLINGDPELTAYLEELRTRPEMRMLFSVTKNATKADVETAVAIIEALRKSEGK